MKKNKGKIIMKRKRGLSAQAWSKTEGLKKSMMSAGGRDQHLRERGRNRDEFPGNNRGPFQCQSAVHGGGKREKLVQAAVNQ